MGPLTAYFQQARMQQDSILPELPFDHVSNVPTEDSPYKIELGSFMDVIKFLLEVRTQAQLLHWGTYKFSIHLALSDLYDGLDKLTDELAELLMGIEGSLDFSNQTPANFNLSVEPKTFINEVIDIFKCSRQLFFDPSAQNKFDEILALFNTTKYKIERLS
jgi:hypothetical protein